MNEQIKQKLSKLFQDYYLNIIFLISFSAIVGSLYFSEVMELEPCKLCWLQRITMYPVAFISAAAIISKDKKPEKYYLPLTLIGLVIGGYHYYIEQLGIENNLASCSSGVPCTEIQWEVLGFITIPFLSLISLIAINLIGFIKLYLDKKGE